MKRTEILTLIEKALSPCNSAYRLSRERTAVRILDKVEEAGMLPPDAMPTALSLSERATADAVWVDTRWKWEDE